MDLRKQRPEARDSDRVRMPDDKVLNYNLVLGVESTKKVSFENVQSVKPVSYGTQQVGKNTHRFGDQTESDLKMFILKLSTWAHY